MDNVFTLKTLTRDGMVDAATLTLAPDGNVVIDVVRHDAFTDSLIEGIPSTRSDRRVMPSEGKIFLIALRKRASRATYWSLVAPKDASWIDDWIDDERKA